MIEETTTGFLSSFQQYGGLIEIIITLSSFAFGVIQWILKKRRQKRDDEMVGISTKIQKGTDHAALVVDLTSYDAKSMIEQIKNSIPQQKKMKPLTDNLIKASPLPADAFASMGADNDFQCGCTERFVTIMNKNWMPDDTEGAKKYISAFNFILNETLSKLKKRHITILHVFYHGPMPICAYLGAKCTTQFKVFFYHFSAGKYYLLGSGGLIKPNAPADEKQ